MAAPMIPPDPSTFIASGASAEVFALEGGRVLKLFHAGVDPATVAREYMTARTIQATGLPVSRALGEQAVGDRAGIVYGWVEGQTLIDHVRHRPWRALWMLGELARLQYMVHRQPLPRLRGRRQILGDDIVAGNVGPRLTDAALNRLSLLAEGDGLTHGDLHPGNVILTPGGGPVLIDWSRAARGAPATDVVRTEMLLRFGPAPEGGPVGSAVRDMAAAYYIRCYRRLSGLEAETLAAWRGLVALAWLRQRLPGRDVAFAAYLDAALAQAGFPPLGT